MRTGPSSDPERAPGTGRPPPVMLHRHLHRALVRIDADHGRTPAGIARRTTASGTQPPADALSSSSARLGAATSGRTADHWRTAGRARRTASAPCLIRTPPRISHCTPARLFDAPPALHPGRREPLPRCLAMRSRPAAARCRWAVTPVLRLRAGRPTPSRAGNAGAHPRSHARPAADWPAARWPRGHRWHRDRRPTPAGAAGRCTSATTETPARMRRWCAARQRPGAGAASAARR